MGSSRWSDADYSSRASYRSATGTPVFAYSASIASGDADAVVHDSLDPKRVAGKSSALAGQNIRECRDSDAHPTSNGVAVLFDVTGSMKRVPDTVQKNLVTLMGLLLRKSYISDPAILVGAIGDAYVDRVPAQYGQFESGIEIENDLTNLYLEGGGGGQQTESYELAFYFLARKTALDCFEKRGKKGYAFIIGDEMAYRSVNRKQVKEIFGDDLQEDIPLAEITREVQEKYDLYFILPNMTSYFNDPKIESFWKELLGQNFIKLEDPNGVSELIATLIGVSEGIVGDNLEDDLKDVGTDIAVAGAVSRAVVRTGRDLGAVSTLTGTGLSGF